MREMNGFELSAEIQEIDNQVMVCFITAGEMYYDEVRNEKLQAEEQYCKLDTERFLQKPISNVDLVERIDKIMKTNKKPSIIPQVETFGILEILINRQERNCT
jgi:two-component SAPR family response regulator